jgi:G:T-mismatch repair DNA endonuclease (very short patch repair protein)
MTLQEIKNNFKKKSWLRLCTLNNINKWELIDSLNEPIYPGKYFINKSPSVSVRNCRICNKEFNLGIYKNNFIVTKNCDCGKDNTNLITIEKLIPFFDKPISQKLIDDVYKSRKKGLKNTIDYWLNLGYDEKDSLKKISEIQQYRSSKSPSTRPGAKGYTNRSLNFWIKKGYSENDAKLKLKESQTTNGLEYYIKKYGDVLGPIKYNERIEKWLNAPANKKMSTGRSKKSITLFEQLGKGYYGKNEKTKRGKLKVHRVDFTYKNKIIEFFGDYWHGNPKKYKSDQFIRNKKVEDIWKHDKEKIEDLYNAGYDVLIIWESDYTEFPKEIIKLCKEFLNDESNIADSNLCKIYRRI